MTNYHKYWSAVFVILIFFCAMVWAVSTDYFQRIEFRCASAGSINADGIAVLLKPVHRYSAVVYLHDSGGSLDRDGIELQKFAELGFAAIGLEFDQTNYSNFNNQFTALLNYLQQQPWIITNEVVWVGSGLGAQRMLSFALDHPKYQPQLLICLSGCWVPELYTHFTTTNLDPMISCPIMIVHAENDELFPVRDARHLVECLQVRGVATTLKIVPERSHGFNPDQFLIARLVAEYCRANLTPKQQFTGSVKRRNLPLWMYMLPPFVWSLFYWCGRFKTEKEEGLSHASMIKSCKVAFYCFVFVIASLALAVTGVQLITPQLQINEQTLAVARRYLMAPQYKEDFDSIAMDIIWSGKPLKVLMEHVELANYNRNELINWKLDEHIYHEFVLSPRIGSPPDSEIAWRRTLWESFYPRVRKEDLPEAAAKIVVRFLRERVTIDPHLAYTPGIETAWNQQLTSKKGFEFIYIAALRSVGIGARLNFCDQAELWTGNGWTNAPRPIIESLLETNPATTL